MDGIIKTSINNNIATVSFFHPASNSFPSILLDNLSQELNVLSTDNSINLIVLKSEGNGAFCAGASFDELLAVGNFEEGKLFFSGFANVINAMRNCSKIIIGRVHGKAVGGGVGIISACDYVFATNNASTKLSELAIGIGPFVIEPAVSRKIGKTSMSEMTLAATEWKNAEWGLNKGLFNQLFDSIEGLDTSLDTFASNLSSYNSEALNEMKKVMWEGTENWNTLLYERAEISGRLVLSEFTKQALKKFKK
ncbi:MAG: enoyl-CoA hydratase/isomerase family protein [Flavobacterium sp.]|jgi:methylglutaconyl-CoA hydratase